MSIKILLVNPPIYDFSAYNFWAKPYGLLRVAGFLRGRADLYLFDYLSPEDPSTLKWGKGNFPREIINKPDIFSFVHRHFYRFGLSRRTFQNFLIEKGPFDFAMVQTGMTYWYLGIKEVIEDIRNLSSGTKIILGGVYSTLCPSHARKIGADLVVEGSDLRALSSFIKIALDKTQPPFWEGYNGLDVGVLKLSDGCPFHCDYCASRRFYSNFAPRPLEQSLNEFRLLLECGVRDIAFYDDALLFSEYLEPFLKAARDYFARLSTPCSKIGSGNLASSCHFHTPNAINPRAVTPRISKLMVEAGFKTFYLGFETSSEEWQRRRGNKVSNYELAESVENLVSAGANPNDITAYIMLGHPKLGEAEIVSSMHFVNSLGIRIMLSDFSPIPGTPDGEDCRRFRDLDEPLWHNKVVFPIILLGERKVNELKEICRSLNRRIKLVDLPNDV